MTNCQHSAVFRRISRITQPSNFAQLHGYRSSPIPLRLPVENPSLLPLVHSTSNLLLSKGPYANPKTIHKARTRGSATEETIVPFFISEPSTRSHPAGFLRPNVLCALQELHESETWRNAHPNLGSPFQLHYSPERQAQDGSSWAVSFAPWVNEGGFALRTDQMNELVSTLNAQNRFPSILKSESRVMDSLDTNVMVYR
jgi:hypothetical protein